jgi:hypothetical protein
MATGNHGNAQAMPTRPDGSSHQRDYQKRVLFDRRPNPDRQLTPPPNREENQNISSAKAQGQQRQNQKIQIQHAERREHP